MPFSENRVEPIERTVIAFIDSSKMTRETFRLAMEDAVQNTKITSFPSSTACLSAMNIVRFDMIVCSLESSVAKGGVLSELAARASPIPILALVDTGCPGAMAMAMECGAAYCVQISEGLAPLIDMLRQFRNMRGSVPSGAGSKRAETALTFLHPKKSVQFNHYRLAQVMK